mgnify:FL=1
MKKIFAILTGVVIIFSFFVYDVCNIKEEKYEKTKQVNLESKELFEDYYNKANELLNTMTIDEKITQLFLVRVPDNSLEEVKKYQFGGYILFGKDTKNLPKDELKNKIASWQNVSKIPLLIAVDEEGGTVVRISNNKNLRETKFKSSQELYNEGGFDLIKEDTKEKNNLLYELGINVNLAPVADVSTNPDDYMYKRSFGKDYTKTKEYIKTVIRASKDTNVSNVLKHFPGYGNNVDTHTGVAIDNRTLDEFRNNDFVPFIQGINDGAEAILVSHNIIENIEYVPASLSKNVHNILKNELKFSGVIMTDDLAMSGITKNITESPSVMALKAGNDLIIITDYLTGINDIKNSLNNNEISEDLINKAVLKIIAWKYYKGLIK